MALPRYIPHYTLDDYRQWEGDWELWSGIPIAMSPSPKLKHQIVAGRVFSLLQQALTKSRCSNCQAVYETDWIVSEDTVLRPDILIVCDFSPNDYVTKKPHFICEVLSESTRRRDLVHKKSLYEKLGVPFYLIVDPDEEVSELFLLDESYRPSADETLQLSDTCTISLPFNEIFENEK